MSLVFFRKMSLMTLFVIMMNISMTPGDDEEKVIAEMGTPHKVAEEFKNEYYDRKNVNDESAKHNNQISWKTVLVCIHWRLGLAYLY